MVFPPADAWSALLEGLTRGLETRGIPFMLIGGQAVLLHGQPRFTEDIDATLGVGPDRLPRCSRRVPPSGSTHCRKTCH